MRRLPIFLALGLVFALFVVAAATAAPPKDFCGPDGTKLDHPSCTTTTTPTPPPPPTTDFEDCVFDGDGVLDGWSETGSIRCVWTPSDGSDAYYSFQIQSDNVETVKLPQLTVNAEPWTPSAVCVNAGSYRGPQDVPFPPDGDPLWTFVPEDSSWWPAADGAKTCAEGGPYLLAIRVNEVKDGNVKLVISPPGDIPPIIPEP
jgi:hypothetical protein